MKLRTVTTNLRGRARRVTFNDREYYVAPLSMIVEGVLNGSEGGLYYPSEELSKEPSAWNHMPIVVDHPRKGERYISARSPSVLEKCGIGFIFNTKYNGKLVAEGYFDIEKTRKVDPRVLDALESGKPMELSTGLFTDTTAREGVYRGKPYTHVTSNYRPDHLAILPDKVGACSLRDGCGIFVNTDGTFIFPLISNVIKRDRNGRFSRTAGGGSITGKAATKLRAEVGAHKAAARLAMRLAKKGKHAEAKKAAAKAQGHYDNIKKIAAGSKNRVAALKSKLAGKDARRQGFKGAKDKARFDEANKRHNKREARLAKKGAGKAPKTGGKAATGSAKAGGSKPKGKRVTIRPGTESARRKAPKTSTTPAKAKGVPTVKPKAPAAAKATARAKAATAKATNASASAVTASKATPNPTAKAHAAKAAIAAGAAERAKSKNTAGAAHRKAAKEHKKASESHKKAKEHRPARLHARASRTHSTAAASYAVALARSSLDSAKTAKETYAGPTRNSRVIANELNVNQPSHMDIRFTLEGLLREKYGDNVYIGEVFDKFVVYSDGEKTFKLPYTTDLRSDKVELVSDTSPKEVTVRRTYVEVGNESLLEDSETNDTQVENSDMAKKLTPEARTKRINAIVSNCGCKATAMFTKDDLPILNKMSDERIIELSDKAKKLAANEKVAEAARQGFGLTGGSTAVWNDETGTFEEKPKEGSDDEETDSEAGAKGGKKGKKTPAANAETEEETEAEAFNKLPKSVRNRLKRLEEAEKAEAEAIVNKLTANTKDPKAKKEAAAVYNAMELDQLRKLAKALPPAPKVNRGGPEEVEEDDDDSEDDGEGYVDYSGAAGGVTNSGDDEEEEDLLLVPTTNWDEEYERQKKEGRK